MRANEIEQPMLQLREGESSEWYVRLVANPDDPLEEVMMHSETYDSRENAERALSRLRLLMPAARVEEGENA